MSYWRDQYLCKNISQANMDTLCSIKFSNDTSMTGNFETLFNITQGQEKNFEDPLPNSLYNFLTLKKIIAAGEGSINIMDTENVNVTFAEAIKAQKQEWVEISETLGFCNSSSTEPCGCEQVYMIYFWLDTLLKETFERQQDGGSI